MPRFEVKAPDGKRYEIEAPDQQSAAAAFEHFQSQQPGGNQPIQQGPGVLKLGGPVPHQRPSLLDEAESFGAGVVDLPIVGGWLSDRRMDAQAGIASMLGGGEFGDLRKKATDRDQWLRDNAGGARVAGQIGGGIAALGGIGGFVPGAARVLGMTGNIASKMALGGASSAVISGGDTLARGGSLKDAGLAAARGGALGVALPVVGGAVAPVIERLFGKPPPSPAIRQVAKGIQREGMTAADVNAKMAALGPEGMLADLGPNLTRQASTLASMPGDAQAIVRQALTNRSRAAPGRMQDELNATLGAAPVPSAIDDVVRGQQQALSPAYEVALSRAQPVNVTSIAQNLDGNIQLTRGDTQRGLQRIRGMLNDTGTNRPTTNPRVLFEVRKEIDAMIGDATSNPLIAALTQVRQRVDAELAVRVPGLKLVDRAFADLGDQRTAVTRGQQVLASGRDAPRPAELVAEFAAASPGVQQRLAQGARAEIDRIVGTNANDVQALNRLIGGEGDWNRARLTTLFGQQRADRIMQTLENELTFSRTNKLVQEGPETAARVAGQKELGEVNVNVPTGATVTGIAANIASRIVNAGLHMNTGHVNRQIAEVLTQLQNLPAAERAEVLRQLAVALGQGPRSLAPAGIAAPTQDQLPAPLGPRPPLRITIPGANPVR